MLPFRVVHIDDDPGSISNLQRLLQNQQGIEYLQGFTSQEEGVAFIRENQVSLLFLDIEMPGHNGLWVADQIKDLPVDIVFFTGHAGYAIQAFEACAIDYLLKPMDEEKLTALLERYHTRKHRDLSKQKEQIQEFYNHYMQENQRPARIFVNLNGQVVVVKLEDVLYFYARDNYTYVVMANAKKHTTSKTIKTYEDALRHNPDFLRIHRSYIVNKNFVEMVERDPATRKITIRMANDESLATSYKTKEEVMDLLVR